EYTLVGPSWKWFYAASAIAIASGTVVWLMMLRGKRSEAKIKRGALHLPTLDSIGGHAAAADVADQIRAAGLISRRGFFTTTVGVTASIASCAVYSANPVLASYTRAEQDGIGFAMLMAGAVIVGVGLNVSLTEEELPVPDATSLLIAGASTLDRAEIAAGFLAHVAAVYETWNERGPASVIVTRSDDGIAVAVADPGR
ncbi:hypothetical protein ADL26_04090, partial [Thermoactinomyces vulgaris]